MPRLTELQTQIILGFGISVTGSLIVAAILSALEADAIPAAYSVSIESTPGGRTEPASGYYTFDEPTVLSVTAIVFDGYVFKGWYLNGEFAGTETTLSFTVEGQNLLIASFEEIDGPQLIPAYIRPVQSCIATDWWDVDTTTELLSNTLHLEHYLYSNGFVKFKICDAAGNGVADQLIALYTDPMPDVTDYGSLLIGAMIHTIDNPLILTSNSIGEVAARCLYRWAEPGDYRETIGQAGKVQVLCPLFYYYDVYPIHDGHYISRACEYTKFTRIRNPIFRNVNPIHVYWVDNPGLTVWGDAYADCNVKFMPSHTL